MSKPRFTITLGRSGQVVKRGERVSDNAHGRADTGAMNGSKRSMGERLGSSANGSFSRNKRPRGDGNNWSSGHNTYQKKNFSPGHNGVHDNNYYTSRIGRNDLRLKLMRKNLKHIRRAVEERRYMERLEKQSKTTQPSASRSMLRQRSEPKGSRFPRQNPHTERPRSPDRVLKASRGGLSQQGNFDDLCQVSSVRAPDASRAGWFLSNDVVGTSRSTGFTPLAMKGPAETLKSVPQLAPMSGIGLQSSHGVEEPLTVSGLLQSLNLGKYNIHFRAEEVDMTALKQMGDKDLKEMGIPMGPRKKILLALRPVQNSSRHNFNL